jgi:hypothetical protein
VRLKQSITSDLVSYFQTQIEPNHRVESHKWALLRQALALLTNIRQKERL